MNKTIFEKKYTYIYCHTLCISRNSIKSGSIKMEDETNNSLVEQLMEITACSREVGMYLSII